MVSIPFSLYDAFSEKAFGGSQAAIVSDASGIGSDTMHKIASELGFPATCFVTDCNSNSITARFRSTQKEYPMCGHATVCLMTQMIETGVLNWEGSERINVQLKVGSANSVVEIYKREDNRALVMLDIKKPKFEKDLPDTQILAALLGINRGDYDNSLPIERASGDFNHLVVPVSDLEAMRRITPDLSGLKQFCLENAIDTVATFCRETMQSDHDIHVRDFCPAVGVAESSAAGTTNAALASYLIRHKSYPDISAEQIVIQTEQGIELNRPSSVRSVITLKDEMINRLQVGGVATKILDGSLYLQPNDHK